MLDYVFDFELEDGPQAETSTSRSNNIIEANLSRTFAANAPSHRAAWKRPEAPSSMFSVLRRDSTESYDETEDSAAISRLATSVPVNITLPRKPKPGGNLLPMERKTGILVPSLIAAMRDRGKATNRLGLTPSRPTRVDGGTRRGSRSASVSRERDVSRSYAADPGAVFEALADEDESQEADQGDTVEEGTLRADRGFVPPHLVARRESRQQSS
jgi:hypothetical protein